ncbi:MAG: helicase-exonuclease AddAB subunit AddA [Clostridia bacterium]|nr:helicase-exonuclease AddAB subunit AddA [Clostridia bacterium]
MPQWTTEQREAINSRGCNLLVAAAAGSGKTAVLVQRIISKICDEENPVDVDNLLVVTFTNAAAQEMKERIGIAITNALKANPLSRHLYRQSILLNKASITTLHSFCLDLVKENFYLLDIDPHFRIADETEAELLRLDVLEDLLEEHYENCRNGDAFSSLIDAYGGQQDDSLIQDLILKLYLFSRSNPWPDHWLNQVVNNFNGTHWFQWLLPGIIMELQGARNLLAEAWQLAGRPQGPVPYQEILKEELTLLDDLIAKARVSWKELYEAFLEINFNRLPAIKKNEVDVDLQERVKNLRDKVKEIVKGLSNKYFQRSPEELAADLDEVKPHLEVLCRLVQEFSRSYQEAKARRNILDFSDLEHFCLKLLLTEHSTPENPQPSELSLKLKDKFEEVLVDEYQDINEVQETILNLVSNGYNLFMVGDVKQSIYRFRLAKPELFQEKYLSFSPREGSKNRRIDLAKNFRCRRAIVDGVNYLFAQILDKEVGEIPYNAEARLVYGAGYPPLIAGKSLDGPVELHLLEKDLPEDTEEDLTPWEREASMVGEIIKGLMESGVMVLDNKLNEYRSLKYSDIVILLRSPRGSVEKFLQQFHLLNIPVYADLGSGYFQATEVQVMLSLLKVIDNPRQDIPLAAVLRSPIVGLSAEELAEISLHCPQGDYYDGVVRVAKQPSPLGEKLNKFLADLERWRTLARQDDLPHLVWTLYRETGYYDFVGAMAGGNQRQANLRALHDRARQYENTSFRGLFAFLRFLERLQENQSDLEGAKALSENEDVVRIMSIHKSKGLEFPVVIVAGLGKEFNFSDSRDDITLHKDLGLGPVFIDPEKRIKYPTIAKLAIDNKIKFETLAEEMRILYVALTRAREKLILVGSVRNLEKKAEDWAQGAQSGERIADSYLIKAKTFLDWIGPALLKHPDCQGLRELAKVEELPLISDDSSWKIHFKREESFGEHSEEIAATQDMLEHIKRLDPVEVNPDYYEQIDKRLNWKYRWQKLVTKGAKVSVTEIKHKFRQLELEAEESKPYQGFGRRPVFMQKKRGLSPAERGSAYHAVMQHLDLKADITPDYLADLLLSLKNRQILSEPQIEVIDVGVIEKFFQSPLGKRMQKAADIRREIPFSLALPAHEIYDDLDVCGEKVLVQGVIDCLWYEEGGWVLLDYKSDYVKPGEVDEFIERYQGQINLYARAVEEIWKQPVKERYLYLFSLGKAVEV